jgi:hypothetical protein
MPAQHVTQWITEFLRLDRDRPRTPNSRAVHSATGRLADDHRSSAGTAATRIPMWTPLSTEPACTTWPYTPPAVLLTSSVTIASPNGAILVHRGCLPPGGPGRGGGRRHGQRRSAVAASVELSGRFRKFFGVDPCRVCRFGDGVLVFVFGDPGQQVVEVIAGELPLEGRAAAAVSSPIQPPPTTTRPPPRIAACNRAESSTWRR